MAQSNDRKILRIGIIQSGKIIEERLLRKRDLVTIGQSPRNTFVLPSAPFARSYTLFDLKGGVYQLNFRDNMDGKVSIEDAVLDFKSVANRKLAERKGDFWSLPLSEKSRGKVVVGDVTLLFQFVSPPPPPSRLQLPANVRGGWIDGMDWPFTACLSGSLALQALVIGFVMTRDFPDKPPGIDAIPDHIVQMIREPKPKVAKDDKGKDEKADDAEGKDEKKKPEDDKPPPRQQPKAKPATEVADKPAVEKPVDAEAHAREVREAVASKSILKYIGTAAGGEGGPSIVDTLKNGNADVSIAAAFDGASGLAVADDKTAERDRRRAGRTDGTGKAVGVDAKDLDTGPAGTVDSGEKGQEVQVKGSVKAAQPSEAFGTGTLDTNKIADTVRRRIGAVKSCYEKELKRNPQLQGKVVIQFTIEESGRVTDLTTKSDTIGEPAVAECMRAAMERWRFDKPEGGSVTVAFPFIFAPSN